MKSEKSSIKASLASSTLLTRKQVTGQLTRSHQRMSYLASAWLVPGRPGLTAGCRASISGSGQTVRNPAALALLSRSPIQGTTANSSRRPSTSWWPELWPGSSGWTRQPGRKATCWPWSRRCCRPGIVQRSQTALVMPGSRGSQPQRRREG